MADEEKKEEIEVSPEVKSDTLENENSEEILDVMDKFDKLASDDNSTDEEDGEEETAEEEDTAEEEKAEEKTTAKNDDFETELKSLEKGEPKKETAEKEVEKPAEEEKQDDGEKYVSDLDPDEWDEEAIELDTKRGQRHLDEMKALKEQNAKLESEIREQETERFTNWVDSRFEKLGEDYVEIFGEGEFDDIDPGSEQFENRAKVVTKMDKLRQAYINTKKPVPSRNKLFQMAVEREFKETITKPAKEKETAEKLKKRASQVIGKGSKKSTANSAEDELMRIQREFDAKIQD